MQAKVEYSITIPIEKINTYRIFAVFIALLTALSMAFIAVATKEDEWRYLVAIGSLGPLLWAIFGTVFFKKNKDWYLRNMIAFTLIAGIAFLFLGQWVGILVIVLSILGIKAIAIPRILFTKENIIFPGLTKKYFSWNEMNNVMLKDDMLTLDFKNNQLMQFNINEKDNPGLHEQDFNNFTNKWIED